MPSISLPTFKFPIRYTLLSRRAPQPSASRPLDINNALYRSYFVDNPD